MVNVASITLISPSNSRVHVVFLIKFTNLMTVPVLSTHYCNVICSVCLCACACVCVHMCEMPVYGPKAKFSYMLFTHSQNVINYYWYGRSLQFLIGTFNLYHIQPYFSFSLKLILWIREMERTWLWLSEVKSHTVWRIWCCVSPVAD